MAPSCFEVILVAFILVLPFLYETSRTFRYYFKFSVYYGSVMFNSVLLIPFFCFRAFNVRNLVVASSFCHYASYILGLRWELRGRENLEKEQACIIVANHQSSLDILGMFDIWPVMDKCTVIAKKEIIYAWPFGIAAWLSGLIFIDRINSEKARSVINSSIKTIKENKIKLWFFPEGTRRNTGEIHPFKKGAFYVAINSQLPVLPVVFSSYYFLCKEEKRFDSGRIIITTLPPISTEGLSKDDVESLMEKTKEMMNETLRVSNLEIQQSLASNT
ncbi:1-acyl-sn-glycerol-3-phosphate acyltransferase alpha [Leptopilina heterotoma]|uniref:1-acyl-sn-glycerol-3-phosphate acyltransferase alpha n=1 Tax=Leptopilina heterotoma TaxID=63436 RepID=UPI001CA8A699|nr:1-acyl-sn-glycerol-3-phosphate acyltransferase alpha [Leptopilina heterotoma]